MKPSRLPFAWTIALCVSGAVSAQEALDEGLLVDIGRIRAVDNHMHGDAVDPARSARWNRDNPLGTSGYLDVVGLQRSNPGWRAAWYALYGYHHADSELLHLQDLLSAKRRTLERAGVHWPGIVLDAAGVDIALLNTARPGPGQTSGRFRWVPYADPLLRPFAGESAWLDYAGGGVSIATLLRESGFSRPPPSLTEYRVNIVNATLARWKKSGAVAIKFLCAHARALDFAVVEEAAAAPVYLKALKGVDALTPEERKLLEDYLFGAIAAAAGARQLVVHIHTGPGDAPFFNIGDANPALLEDVLNAPAQRETRFVLLHGGWPYPDLAQAMMDKPNTWADFSAQTLYPGTLQIATVLRNWLAWHPEKVLFGSDAHSDVDSPLTDWEEREFLMTHKARRALAMALTAMMQDGEITRPRALDIARLVLRDNALRLYGLAPPIAP